MNKTLSKVIASAMVAVTLMTAAPVTASAANNTTTTTSTSTSASASASTSTYKTMYAVKSVYSYKNVNGKLVKSTAVYKGTALKVKSSTSKYYILSDGRYINKTAVGAKRINWTDIKYSKPLTRYISKDNTKARAGALTSSKVSTTLDKGTQVTIVARTTSGFYKLDDGSYILQTSTTKTKPASTQGTTTYAVDTYGPGENGYEDIVHFDTDAGDGGVWEEYGLYIEGYVFENGYPKVEDYTVEGVAALKKMDGYFEKGKAVAGKDIPYGWYVVASAGMFGDYDKTVDRPYLKIVDKNGKVLENNYLGNIGASSYSGTLHYVPKGATVYAGDVTLAPAPNAIFSAKTSTYRTGNIYTPNSTVQTMLVSNDGYGIKPGTYKVIEDNLAQVDEGQYVYVVHNYLTMPRHDNAKHNCTFGTLEGLVTNGEFVWHTKENAKYPRLSLSISYTDTWDTKTCEHMVDDEGQVTSKTSNVMPKDYNKTSETITLREGDMVICYGVSIEAK